MPQLVLALLGPFAATLDGQPITTFKSVKVRALLAYLAVEADHPQSRAVLAELLWPELPNDAARTYLRHALGKLREAIADHTAEPRYLLATRDTVQFNLASDHVLDVASFTSLLAACDAHPHRHAETCRSCAKRRAEALAYYREDFLAHFFVRDSAEFEAWAALKRERLRGQCLRATTEQASYYARRGDDATAQHYLEHQLALDPWDEAARRQLMTSLWRCGQRSAALAHYLHCRQVLEQDLRVEPEEATTALFAHIRDSGERPPQDDEGAKTRAGLPAPTTPFIGRGVEVAQFTDLLQNPACRLVTLTGTGGIGKTRLALELASDLCDEFPDGIAFVELAPVLDPDQVIPAVAKALGVQEVGTQPLLESLKVQLRARQLLLILDNLEHLITAAPNVAELLAAAPHLTVLVSSRASLHLYGEHEFAVAPLALPDRQLRSAAMLGEFSAVALFVQRAQLVRPTFKLMDANAQAVAEICRRLDGLPLAIELAAARSKLFAPAALLARLEPRLSLLNGGPQDVPARQRTMRATIDWSYRLLDMEEQRLFARLAVFVGGWTVEAAKAVCNADGELAFDVLDGLQSLLDQSLLHVGARPEGEPRFTMLETIREYAREHLDYGGEVALLRRLHATYYLALAEAAAPELHGGDPVPWSRRLAPEHDNLRAALAWSCTAEDGGTPPAPELHARLAVALTEFWDFQDSDREALTWLEGVLAHQAQLPPLLYARACLHAATFAWYCGDPMRATARGQESLALFQAQGDRTGAAYALKTLGNVAFSQQEYGAAAVTSEASLALFRAVGDRIGIAWALYQLGRLALNEGDHARAAACYQESLQLCEEVGRSAGKALALWGLGWAALAQGKLQQARQAFMRSFHLRRDFDNQYRMALCADGLACVTAVDHPRDAVRLLGAAAAVRDVVDTEFDTLPTSAL